MGVVLDGAFLVVLFVDGIDCQVVYVVLRAGLLVPTSALQMYLWYTYFRLFFLSYREKERTSFPCNMVLIRKKIVNKIFLNLRQNCK